MTVALTPIRDLAAAVRKSLEADGVFGQRSFTVRAHRNRNARRILIDWYGIPTEAQVLAPIGAVLAGQDAFVCLNRELMWSCGSFHKDEEAAWIAHEGQEHLVLQCGCGAVAALGDSCDDDNLTADDIPRYCSQMGDDVLLDSVREDLAAAGETFESACHPGDYVNCPVCGGYGTVIDLTARTSHACPACNRDRVFDLALPDDQVRYQAALASNAEANARAEAERARQTRARRPRHLP
jgi:hypothetical protein